MLLLRAATHANGDHAEAPHKTHEQRKFHLTGPFWEPGEVDDNRGILEEVRRLIDLGAQLRGNRVHVGTQQPNHWECEGCRLELEFRGRGLPR